MITLIQAVKLLKLDEHDLVYLCKKPGEFLAPLYSVREMRDKLDMKRTKVVRIMTHYHLYSPDVALAFVVVWPKIHAGGGALDMKKALKHEVSPSEMLYMRQQEGLSNKQIATRLGISVNTVYRYIGKRSFAVANAQAQNKPVPVPASIATGRYRELPVVEIEEDDREEIEEEMPQQKEPAPVISVFPDPAIEDRRTLAQGDRFVPNMPIIHERKIVSFQGEHCVYEVDTGDRTVTMKDGEKDPALVQGVLDRDALHDFIRELMQVYRMLQEDQVYRT